MLKSLKYDFKIQTRRCYMRLLEFESKLLFSEFGIPIPKGKAIADANEVKKVWDEWGCRKYSIAPNA